MNIDPQKASDTRTWLVKAWRDLITAEQLFAFENPLLDSIVYHCHQAAEKALKGYLFWHDTPFRKTHNLEELRHPLTPRCFLSKPTQFSSLRWRHNFDILAMRSNHR